jgi:hypothetical protein
MKASQFIPVPKVKVLVIPKVPMEEEVLVIIKPEPMEDITIVPMLPKIEPNVLGVTTNDKRKWLLIKVFELSGD